MITNSVRMTEASEKERLPNRELRCLLPLTFKDYEDVEIVERLVQQGKQ